MNFIEPLGENITNAGNKLKGFYHQLSSMPIS